MKATCILCAVVLVLLVDFFSQTSAEDSGEEASPAWLAGNRMFHGLDQFQRQSRWGGRHIRPQGRVPRAYDGDDEVQVFRRWGGRRVPYRGGHKRDWEKQIPNSDKAMDGQYKRAAENGQEMLDDVYPYLRN
ncbi:uncharacterized protein LOC119726187 [Patiria miniata]|uniref:Uncharacterized protein n=1 Tax=Patiria miniata TaxID=46514 RepID=A0A913ZRE1_PATMI|nr:uncharacterized protein LOC119726187 [Patiria miniata]